jgi:hypothetical protein
MIRNVMTAMAGLWILLFAGSCAKQAPQILELGTATAGDSGFTYRITVADMQFHWRAESTVLHVKLKAPTTGWLSIGFNPAKGMQDANFIIGLIKDGQAVITDQHGIDPKHHRVDTELGGMDNVMNPAGWESNNETEISFGIPIQSTDALDKPLTLNGNTVILLAYGPTKQLAQQHVMWAKANLNLSTGQYAVTLLMKAK